MTTHDVSFAGPVRLLDDRERVLAYAAVIALVAFRSALFAFRLPLNFDSDEAVFGLMAKHLAEGRAFPLFMYGQSYILAVEAWLAAPLFLVFGPSVAALKLPLLAINVAVGLLLVRLLERECGLRPRHALVASLFFVLAPPGTVGSLMAASGGNVEPFLYVLLLWITRRRPVWFGLVAGLGFLHREFTIYGVVAVVLLGAAAGTQGTRQDWRLLARGLRVAAETWLVVQVLRPFASAAGPGTAAAELARAPANNLVELANRSCFEVATVERGIVNLVTVQWPRLFGTQVVRLWAFGLDSGVVQGHAWLGPPLAAAALLVLVRLAVNAGWNRAWWQRHGFCAYLVVIGLLSSAAWAVARCGTVSPMRYDLLSLLGAVGLTSWFLAVERRGVLRGLVVAAVIGWAGMSAAAHARIWDEYFPHRPAGAKFKILASLEAGGIRYAEADYWTAYYVTFVSGERVIVASNDVVTDPRIQPGGPGAPRRGREGVTHAVWRSAARRAWRLPLPARLTSRAVSRHASAVRPAGRHDPRSAPMPTSRGHGRERRAGFRRGPAGHSSHARDRTHALIPPIPIESLPARPDGTSWASSSTNASCCAAIAGLTASLVSVVGNSRPRA